MASDETFGVSFEAYSRLVEEIPFGKRLPTATYVHVDGLGDLPAGLLAFLAEVQRQVSTDSVSFNLIKFHRDEFKISLLDYPDFMSDPHPALSLSTVINLENMDVSSRSYSASSNRPILHRKETFLPPHHERVDVFRQLTSEEERLGLYRNRTKIGFEKQWQALLEDRDITYDGHSLISKGDCSAEEGGQTASGPHVDVRRSKTALSRFGFSRPVQQILKYELINSERSFFDYGCGLGDDVRALKKMGYGASGWDPIHLPESEKRSADIVNLGFVINVIEDPHERAEVLRDAYSLAEHVLVAAVQVGRGEATEAAKPYRDGVLTSRGTFQRYYEHDEFGRFIEEALDVGAISAGNGIFFIFKNPIDSQAFLQRKSSRAVDFGHLRESLFGSKPRKAPAVHHARRRRSFYELHQSLLDDYWSQMVRLGRPPGPEEYERFEELAELGLTQQKAKNLFVKLFGGDALDEGFIEKNSELVHGYWDRLIEFGRVPREEEYGDFDALDELGVAPEQLRNLYLRVHGEGSLERAFRKRHEGLIDEFWQATIRLGRVPSLAEFERHDELTRIGLRPPTLHRWFIEEFGKEVFEQAVQRRRDDLLVYLALANFRRKVPFRHLPSALQVDIKTFFGSYQRALDLGRDRLFALGQSGAVAKLCEDFKHGWQDGHSLYIHASLLTDLPAELRILLGCAEILEGDLTQADIIKIHKQSSKVTLLSYQDFDRRSFPVLESRVKISLADQFVQYFDHSSDELPQVLCNKHRFVGMDHPKRASWEKFHGRVERAAGPISDPQLTLGELRQRLFGAGYDMRLRRTELNREK